MNLNTSRAFGTYLGDELSPSTQPVIGSLTLAGFIGILLSDQQFDPETRLRFLLFSLLCYAAAIITFLIGGRYPTAGRWLLSFMLVVVVTGGLIGVQSSAFLAMLPMPIIAAMLVAGFPAAITATILQSLLLIAAVHYGVPVPDPLIVQAALWLTLLLLLALFLSVRQVSDWLLHHYQRVQTLLEEARDRSAHLKQVLNELMHANRQLDLLNERLAAARLAAEESHKAKAAFVAKVSHEFRTPLNMIIGLTDLLMETPDVYGDALPLALFDDLQIVHRNCIHLTSMINDVLAISQTETGRLSLHREWIDLHAEIETAVAVVQPLVEKKHLALHVHIPSALPKVYCDRTRIRQVVLNLISNAARYTEQGTIGVEIVHHDHSVTVGVADTGPGIAPQDLEHIFEPFNQGTDGAWRDHSGSGLGLAISRQFIELHGGQIWVESKLGSGSRFVFKLPIFPPAPPMASSARWINEEWMWRERSARAEIPKLPYRQRIVLCDETGELDGLVEEICEAVEVINVDNLQVAIAAVEEVPAHGLILNTLSPNRMWLAVEEARRRLPDTPIFGYLLPHAIDPSLESGVMKYLLKPVTRADLKEVMSLLERPPGRVLIADDDQDFRQLLARMLQAYDPGLDVLCACNGEEALSLLHSHAPDLVLLDITMPNFDGWQVLDHKNQDPAVSDIPVAIVSAQDPMGQSPAKGTLIANMGGGIPVSKLLHATLNLADQLLHPEPELVPTRVGTLPAEPALSHSLSLPGPTPDLFDG